MATKITAPPTPPDEAPDQTPDTPPDEGDEPVREPPAEASNLGAVSVDGKDAPPTWNAKYRSAMDNPRHPLHHLRNA